jgi:recombination protein RecA
VQSSTVEELRQRLSRSAPYLGERPTLSRGIPKGAITILTGDRGAGRLTFAAKIAAEETKASRPIAWIDAKGTLYPPALAAAGVELSRVLMVKSEDERVVYAAEQIVSSGAFGLVVATGLDSLLTPSRARRLQLGAEGQQVSLLLVLDPPAARRITNAALKLDISKRGRASGSAQRAERAETGARA